MKITLAKWSKDTFGDLFKEIATLEDIIKAKEAQFKVYPSTKNRGEKSMAESKFKKFRNIKEKYWK